MEFQMPKKKLVYPLRQICRMTDLPDKEIKSWEKKFTQLKPVRFKGSNRYYTENDLKLIFYIRDLIYVHKLSENEMKEKLKQYNPSKGTESISDYKQILSEIKMEIEDIQELLL